MAECTSVDWPYSDLATGVEAEQVVLCKCRIVLVGGKRIVRRAVEGMLVGNGIVVSESLATPEEFEHLFEDESYAGCDAIVLLLSGAGPFGTFKRIQDSLARIPRSIPLVILSEQVSRGQVYAALRTGAKAYVDLDADPSELVKAIDMAAHRKVYLSSDVAELLVNDISTTGSEESGGRRLPRLELSRREVEIVQLLCEGMSSKEIGRNLHISSKTVENHRYNTYRKCEVDSIAGLMRYAIQHGIVTI